MARGIVIGLVLGALIAAGLFKGIQKARAGSGAEAVPAARAATKPDPGAPAEGTSSDASTLAADKKALEEELKNLEVKIAAEKKSQAAAAKAARRKNPWASIGAKLFRLRDQLDDLNKSSDPEAQKLMTELMTIFTQLAKDHKLRPDEFEYSPYGLPMLMLAVLGGSDQVPDEAQQAKLDEIMEAAEANWEKLQAERENRTALQLQRDMFLSMDTDWNRLHETMTPAQQQLIDSMEFFQEGRRGHHSWQQSGSRESITESFVSDWSRTLGISESQQTAIRPVVEQYMRGYEALDAQFPIDPKTNKAENPTARALAEMDLMIETQKRISESVRLDEKQMKALNRWSRVYGFKIQ